jgi:cytoskeletal protein RodZ
VSNRKPPQRTKVYRAGSRRRSSRSRGGSSGLGRFLTGPVGLILLGVLVVFGLGYWVKNYGPEAKAETPPKPAEVTAPKAGNTAPTTPAPAPVVQNPAPAPSQQQSTPAPADPTKDIVAKRSQIDRSGGAAKTSLLTIYYADGLKATDTLQPVQVRVEQTPSQIRRVSELIVQAPEDLKLFSGVPAGTKVLSVNFNSNTGVATVDLSAELAKVQAGDVAKIKAAFVYSLTQIQGVKSVQLWVNGRPAMLHEQEWSKPLSPADIDALKAFTLAPVVKFQP